MGKCIIVYYSMDGNTRQIAERIRSETGFPLIQLETVVPYTGTDEEIIAQGQEEVNRGYQPELKTPGRRPGGLRHHPGGNAHLVVHHGLPRPQLSPPGGLAGKDPGPVPDPRGLAGALSGGHGASLPGRKGPVSQEDPFQPQQFGKPETPQRELESWLAELKTL